MTGSGDPVAGSFMDNIKTYDVPRVYPALSSPAPIAFSSSLALNKSLKRKQSASEEPNRTDSQVDLQSRADSVACLHTQWRTVRIHRHRLLES